jgi:PAP2 superfamily
MSIARFVTLLGAIVAVFLITLTMRPLAPLTLITNPLFAIGFGAPLVLHLSSLPRWRELAATIVLGMALSLGAVQLAGVNAFPQWIVGFGVASTIVLGVRALRRDRDALLFLLPSAIALFFTMEVSLFLDIISTVPRLTYDAHAYVADYPFGGAVSFRVGQLFASVPLIGILCTAIYLAPPPGLIFIYALQVKSKTSPRMDIVSTLVLMGAAGYALYFLVPACGPKFVFPSFPQQPPDPEPLIGTLIAAPRAPRNAIPSLHMASALIAYIHARRHGRIARAVAAVFVLGTFLGTMGTGEHYFVDLVVAAPFTATMYWLLERRFARAAAPAAVLFVWLWMLRFHDRLLFEQPWMAWAILGAACAVSYSSFFSRSHSVPIRSKPMTA